MDGLTFVALVAVQRLAELAFARRNTRALRAAGAREHGAAHYPAMVAMHAAWLGAMAWAALGQTVAWGWVAAYLLLQVARLWTIRTLGPRWTTRILILPDAPLITGGPFRLLRHPNYVVVALELALVPLALDAPRLALTFALLNAAMMRVRVRAEEKALYGSRPEARPAEGSESAAGG